MSDFIGPDFKVATTQRITLNLVLGETFSEIDDEREQQIAAAINNRFEGVVAEIGEHYAQGKGVRFLTSYQGDTVHEIEVTDAQQNTLVLPVLSRDVIATEEDTMTIMIPGRFAQNFDRINEQALEALNSEFGEIIAATGRHKIIGFGIAFLENYKGPTLKEVLFIDADKNTLRWPVINNEIIRYVEKPEPDHNNVSQEQRKVYAALTKNT